jgi:hypothetical protein
VKTPRSHSRDPRQARRTLLSSGGPSALALTNAHPRNPVAQAIGVLFMPESVAPRAGALRSLRPHLRLPPEVRGPALVAAPVLIATRALVGLYGSLGPSVVRRLIGSSSLVLGGLVLFALAASGAATVLLARARAARSVLLFGSGALIAGVSLTLLAIASGAPGAFFAGAVLAGAGFGCGFQGAIRTVVPLAAAHQRAGVLSVLYVIAYLSMGVPAVFAGLRVVHGGGLLATAHEYGIAVIVLAAAALLGTVVTRPVSERAAVLRNVAR